MAATIILIAIVALGCAAGAARPGATPVTAGGASLLRHRCASCHAVPRPDRMSHDDWLYALTRMRKRMTLPAAEWDSLAAMARPEDAGPPSRH